MPAGVAILDRVHALLGVPMHVCSGGIREGAVLATVGRSGCLGDALEQRQVAAVAEQERGGGGLEPADLVDLLGRLERAGERLHEPPAHDFGRPREST